MVIKGEVGILAAFCGAKDASQHITYAQNTRYSTFTV
jgi:hypothetical protein